MNAETRLEKRLGFKYSPLKERDGEAWVNGIVRDMWNELLRLERENEWIPVSMPPPKSGEYLGWISINDLSQNPRPNPPACICDRVYYRSGIGWRYAHYGVFVKPTIEFWRELPQPPEREK